MPSPPRIQIGLIAVAFIFLAPLLQGCDGLTSANEKKATLLDETQAGKVRHAHLIGPGATDGAGKVLDRYAELSTETELVLGFSATVLEPQRVLDRYSLEAGVQIKRLLKKSIHGFAMHIDADQLDRLLGIIELDDDIAWMEPDIKFNMPKSGKTYPIAGNQQDLISSLPYVGGDQTSTLPGDGTGAVDVDIYILDTGIDHPDINVVERVDFTTAGQEIDMTKVLDRYSDTMESYSDAVGHGTHVAGIAAAIDDSDHMVGMAPGARVHDFKVLDDTGQGDMSSVIAALDVIVARKELAPETPMVVNLSLGADIGTSAYNALDEAVLDAIDRGIVVVVAAGNQAIDVATVTPAHVAEAITVGASTSTSDPSITAFSNYGDGVDLYAAGENVISLSPEDYKFAAEMSGTSMAAPLVTGAAALILAQDPTASPQAVRTELLRYAGYYKITKNQGFHVLYASSF